MRSFVRAQYENPLPSSIFDLGLGLHFESRISSAVTGNVTGVQSDLARNWPETRNEKTSERTNVPNNHAQRTQRRDQYWWGERICDEVKDYAVALDES